jgi:DNA-3-methyladenine glycosylase I
MANKVTSTTRCPWAKSEAEAVYHDTEWGVPSRDETHLFEMITLEGAQAGLSWSTILNKREGYRTLFKGFDPAKVARFTPKDVERLMADASIVRNRLKIESTIDNAKALCRVHDAGDTLADLCWSVVDGQPLQNRRASLKDLPPQTPESKALSKLLKSRGFRFVGPTTMYAFMQACGLVNDHLTTCPRHTACKRKGGD